LKEDNVRILFCQDAGESNKTILYDSDYYSSDTKGSPPATPMARSWNGSQHQMGKTKLEVGSLKDDWRPSYMRTMPSLSIPDQARRHVIMQNIYDDYVYSCLLLRIIEDWILQVI
jgi:hypothetical protein